MKSIYLFLTAASFLLISVSSFAQKINYQKEITITNDGWKLKGDLMLIKSKLKSPVVLMLNKANGNRQAYTKLAALLAEKNISSLRLDLRGHGESINKGKFIPFDSVNNAQIKMDDTYTDIIAAYKYLLSIKYIDPKRVGIIGASYSGEEMMNASRKFKSAKSYVALSPGSFSDTSIMNIDSMNTTMLFIKSMDEKSMQGFEKKVFDKNKKAQFIVVPGNSHATDILLAYPEISQLIADWFRSHL